MDKPTWSKVLSILLTAVIALAAVIGYDITIIQPRAAAPPLPRAAGDTNFTNVIATDITGTTVTGTTLTGTTVIVGGYTLSVSAPLTVTGVITNTRIITATP